MMRSSVEACIHPGLGVAVVVVDDDDHAVVRRRRPPRLDDEREGERRVGHWGGSRGGTRREAPARGGGAPSGRCGVRRCRDRRRRGPRGSLVVVEAVARRAESDRRGVHLEGRSGLGSGGAKVEESRRSRSRRAQVEEPHEGRRGRAAGHGGPSIPVVPAAASRADVAAEGGIATRLLEAQGRGKQGEGGRR